MAGIDVVYIEDDDIEAELFSLGLSTRGVNVLHLPDAEPGSLHLLQKAPYVTARAIFIDFWIGVVSGLDVAKWLRENGDSRPFFLLTAGENPDPNMLKQLNITYLQKPANYNKVASAISAL
ncbi:MAG: response regulator [Anaerolineaceae bacterium]|nr:response regulator [Anaerolineaceae bacterium]